MTSASESLFEAPSRSIDTVTVDGRRHWLLADACDMLGYRDQAEALTWLAAQDHISRPYGDVFPGPGSNQGRPISLVTDAGLVTLILCCDQEQARPFQQWVLREVLPAIGTTGAYIAPDSPIADAVHTNPATAAPAVRAAVEEAGQLMDTRGQADTSHTEVFAFVSAAQSGPDADPGRGASGPVGTGM
jgi:prophage antirepressor-like protein